MRPLTPIRDDELEHLFAPLARWQVWLLAVSGGPDSLALMHLLAHWHAISAPPATLTVATVDHGLRPASAAEAAFVAAQADALGLPHITLSWSGDKPATGLINAARNARYDLLIKHLATLPGSPRALITAHHQDDQAETVLMRLARGSGVDGLAAMESVRLLDATAQISLVRPLLAIPKTRLEDTLRARHQTWIDDPTNSDLKTERARLRHPSAATALSSALPPSALALTARRMALARDALDHATSQLEAQAALIVAGLSYTIAHTPFALAPFELRVRLLARALARCGGTHPQATRAEIEALVERLETNDSASTLGGCRIDPTAGKITIHREPGRSGLPNVQLQPGMVRNWDNRFEVALSTSATAPCDVRALTHDEWLQLRKVIPPARVIPTPAALTIPSFWVNGACTALPTLGYCSAPNASESPLCQAVAISKSRYEPL